VPQKPHLWVVQDFRASQIDSLENSGNLVDLEGIVNLLRNHDELHHADIRFGSRDQTPEESKVRDQVPSAKPPRTSHEGAYGLTECTTCSFGKLLSKKPS
jgi:hypothetical protein